MSIKDRVINNLKERRNRLLNGEINSIPSPFPRFSDDFVGVEQGKYYLITSRTKGGKSQFGSFVFIFQTLLYAYANPDKLRIKIFYYPLEETPENVLERFICYLLNLKHKIRISPKDLRSTDNNKPLNEDILKLLDTEEYSGIIKFFEENVIFSQSTNATGVWKECKKYAEDNGVVHTKKIKVTGDLGETKEVDAFDYYEPNDPKEYKIIFYDHVSLTSIERGLDLRQSIGKLSEYFVILRNRYKFSPVVIQQQAFFETTDAFKMDKLKPSIATLADNKAVSRDCNMCLSLFSPYAYELRDYLGYDITKFKDNIRFLEVLLNRDGQSNGIVALYFDGCNSTFAELPLPNNEKELNKVYSMLNKNRTSKVFITFVSKLKKFFKNG